MAGKPIEGADITVRMRRHAFAWGTAVDVHRLIAATGPDADHFRQIVETYFNKVVFENDSKWGRWLAQKPIDRQNILAALNWLDARHIPVRGHVLVWPSWKQKPQFLRGLEKTPEALRTAVLAHIDEQTAMYGKRVAEWDVINETFTNNDLLKILGRSVMIDWFKQAHAGAPDVKLFYYDFVMFHGMTPESPSQYLFDTVNFLVDQGAPIWGIGEQGHFGGNPPGPARILQQLDRFATLGLPIQITEFDIDTPDEQLAADFTRDFTTAVFSHPAVTGMVQWGFWEPAH